LYENKHTNPQNQVKINKITSSKILVFDNFFSFSPQLFPSKPHVQTFRFVIFQVVMLFLQQNPKIPIFYPFINKLITKRKNSLFPSIKSQQTFSFPKGKLKD